MIGERTKTRTDRIIILLDKAAHQLKSWIDKSPHVEGFGCFDRKLAVARKIMDLFQIRDN